jgi:hypothetical protein
MARVVALQEAGETADGGGEVVLMGQKDDPQVVGMGPVEATALHQPHLLLQQQVEYELLIVSDGIVVGVESRKKVQGRLGLDATDAGDRRDQIKRQVALFAQTAGGQHQVIDALVTAERGLDGVLGRDVGAQPHRGEEGQALEVVLRVALLARYENSR